MSKVWFEVYKDVRNKWRWHLRCQNGRILASSAIGYNKKCDLLDSLHTIQIDGPFARIVTVSD